MVMRWKILDIVQNSASLQETLEVLVTSQQFDIDRDGALALLREYTEILPENILSELEACDGQ